MPDKRTHRGPHPEDRKLFASEMWPRLAAASNDLCWLLSRRYPAVSALKIVGDRYALDQRQRMAVGRCACSDEARRCRSASQVGLEQIAAGALWIDGYNVLTSIEAALAGGVILSASDGCFRDIASIHGTWRKVYETVPAVEMVGQFLTDLSVSRAVWLLDSPVSNSGRLKAVLAHAAAEHGWPWEIELVPNPDAILSKTDQLVATADSGILDECCRWVNLARAVIERFVPQANIVPFTADWNDSSPL